MRHSSTSAEPASKHSLLVLLYHGLLFASGLVNFVQLRFGLLGEFSSPQAEVRPQTEFAPADLGESTPLSPPDQSRRQLRGTTVTHDIIPQDFSHKTTFTPAESSTGVPFRMLLGIFTTSRPTEFARRKLIRKTYLSYFDLLNAATSNLTGRQWTNRICALADLLEGNTTNLEACQLVYTFVVGGADSPDQTAPTELLVDDPAIPMTLARLAPNRGSTSEQEDRYQQERDITYLNIRENMNEGKTVTWFKYASSRIPKELKIDLIAKVDTDTVVFPSSLLDEVRLQLGVKNNLEPPTLVYGGHEITSRHYYMQGGFYFLSQDLAQYISSDSCPRDEIIRAHIAKHGHRAEDREIGAFVKRRERSPDAPKAQRLYLPPGVGSEHSPRMKKDGGFRGQWKIFFAKDVARRAYQSLPWPHAIDPNAKQDGAVANCPSAKSIQEALEQFDSIEKMKRAKEVFLKYLGRCGQQQSTLS